MNYDINSLNEEQLAPLLQIKGAVLVTAGAGSGKTRLLTHRVAYLIEHEHVDPYNILAITFTNKAAGEMKERISNMVEGAERVWISTFHSMCAKMLRMDIENMPPFTRNFTIYNESDSDKLLKEILAERGITDDKLKKNLVYHLSDWKNNTQTLGQYIDTHTDEFGMGKIGEMMNAYQEKLKKNNALDFDDLLVKTMELLKTCPNVLEYYRNRFEYILVDEFQDTNMVQYELIKLLSSLFGNVFAVGDEDQCIYSWRGANFKNIFNFKRDFPDAKLYKLQKNYRSTKQIITVANNVIKNNTSRLDKKMWTDNDNGEKPSLYNAYDERDEALFVARTIEKLVAKGYDYKDIVVLMRMNALSRSFEEAFLSYNIPHRIFGGFKFYERVEIRNIIAYLRLFTNQKDDISFQKVINFPKRGIGEGTIAKVRNIEPNNSLLENTLSQEMKENPALYKKFAEFIDGYNKLCEFNKDDISNFVENVIKTFKIRESYNIKDEDDLNKIMNIEQFISSSKEFEKLNPEASLGDFLESITLSSDNDEIGEGGAVTIATVHAVKGLEFQVVFVVGLEEGIFPISRAFTSNAELEEERRLLYVALTRAERLLYMSHASKRYLYKGSQYQMPSRFCRELGLLSLEEKSSKQRYSNSYSSDYPYSSRPSRNDSALRYENIHESNNFDSAKQSFNDKIFNPHTLLKKKEDQYTPSKDTSIYKVGQKVSHPKFGNGEIVDITSDHLVGDIVFEKFGKKSLMLELAPLTIMEG